MTIDIIPTRRPLRVTSGGQAFEIAIADHRLSINDREYNWSLAGANDGWLNLILDGRSYDVHVRQDGPALYAVTIEQQTWRVQAPDEFSSGRGEPNADGASEALTAPMPGRVLRVMIEPGDVVDSGQGLVVLEAMKMENELRASRPGTVSAVHIEEGQAVKRDAILIEFD